MPINAEKNLLEEDIWCDKINDIELINWYIENNKDKKIIIKLPVVFFDNQLIYRINNLNAVVFEATDGRRFTPQDIISINEKILEKSNEIKNSDLSPLEKLIAIYAVVTNFKSYKLVDDGYNNERLSDYGRSPYLFYNDDYMNCFGYTELLCILCRNVGINISAVSVEEDKHRICYVHIVDNKYGIDGYFRCDPTKDSITDENNKSSYNNMIGRIINNNFFEIFLNSDMQLSPKSIKERSLFSKYIMQLEQYYSFLNRNQLNLDELIYSFRDNYRSKNNYIGFETLYSAILYVSDCGFASSLNEDEKMTLKSMLFLQELKEESALGRNTDELIDSYIKSQTGNLKK